jgi:hypothetical protein
MADVILVADRRGVNPQSRGDFGGFTSARPANNTEERRRIRGSCVVRENDRRRRPG